MYVAWSNRSKIWFDRSTDGGATWLTNDIFVSDQPGGWDYGIPGIYRANGLPVTACDLSGGAKRVHEGHDRLYGYALPDTPLDLVNVRAVALGLTEKPSLPEVRPGTAALASQGSRRVWPAEERAFLEMPVHDGERLGAGARLGGPVVVELDSTTVIVPPAWRLETDRHGSFLLERV
ncbi:MAG: hypothetical protein HY953_00100 [Candidatus Rokubacteria bacterium]|nr:hypothetical protein [Candidatus Rokubacteria bacterium]